MRLFGNNIMVNFATSISLLSFVSGSCLSHNPSVHEVIPTVHTAIHTGVFIGLCSLFKFYYCLWNMVYSVVNLPETVLVK